MNWWRVGPRTWGPAVLVAMLAALLWAAPGAAAGREGSAAAPRTSGASLPAAAAARRCRAKRLAGGRYRTRGCHFRRLRARPRKRLGQSTRPFGAVPPPATEPDESETAHLPRGPFRPPRNLGRASPLHLGEPAAQAGAPQAGGAGGPTNTGLRFGTNLDLGTQGLSVATPTEPSVAAAGNVVLYTQNWTAGYSTDGGATWKSLNPYSDVPSVFGGFCCDQVVIYVPQVRKFVWLLQYKQNSSNENAIRMVVASPEQVAAGKPSTWARYDFDSSFFGLKRLGLDQPDLAVGAGMLYMTVDRADLTAGTVSKSFVLRIGVNELGKGQMGVQVAQVDRTYLHPVQHVGRRGYFAQFLSTTKLRVWFWDENSNQLAGKLLNVSTIADKNWTSTTPGGSDWLNRTANSGGYRIRGATLAGDQVWLAWSAARDTTVGGKTKQLFKQPHIEIAKLNAGTLALNDQDYIFSNNYAFARPVLDTNARGDVGLGFAWGGGNYYAGQGAGFLTGKRDLWATLKNDADAGKPTNPHGDYATIRAGWPRGNCFVTPAVGWRSGKGVARLVAFGRAADSQCTRRPGFGPLRHTVTFDGLADGTLVTTQAASQGATFGSSAALGFPGGGQPRHTCPDGPTVSGGVAVAPDCPSSGGTLRDSGLLAKLTATGRIVSVRIGTTQAQPGGFAADLDGYDANGNHITTNAVLVGSTTNGQGAGPVESVTIQSTGSSAPIAYVALSLDASFSPGPRLVFDDLTYSSS